MPGFGAARPSASSGRLALRPLLAWLPFVTACTGPLAGLGLAPAHRVPALRWSFLPPIACGFGKLPPLFCIALAHPCARDICASLHVILRPATRSSSTASSSGVRRENDSLDRFLFHLTHTPWGSPEVSFRRFDAHHPWCAPCGCTACVQISSRLICCLSGRSPHLLSAC